MQTSVELIEVWVAEADVNIMELAVIKHLLWDLKMAVAAADLDREMDCYEELVKFLVLERGYA